MRLMLKTGRLAGLVFCALLLLATPLYAEGDPALAGVKGLDAVFDISVGSPGAALAVFPAIRGAYQHAEVKGLERAPRVVLVFRGKAVKLLTKGGPMAADDEEKAALAKMIRQFKADGVKLDVCLYAAQMQGVDPAILLPEIDVVDNGFISILGYQAQGYGVVRVN